VVYGGPPHVAAADPQEAQIKILADGRVIDLMPLEQVHRLACRAAETLHLPEHGDVITTLTESCADSALHCRKPRNRRAHAAKRSLDAPFAIWEDGRAR